VIKRVNEGRALKRKRKAFEASDIQYTKGPIITHFLSVCPARTFANHEYARPEKCLTHRNRKSGGTWTKENGGFISKVSFVCLRS